jgi:hypothetical protein
MRILHRCGVAALILLALLSSLRPLAAQNWSGVGGGFAGFGAGVWVGLGYATVQACTGTFIETPEQAVDQMALPILVGLATGIGIGVSAEDRLNDTVLWAAVGWASGLGLGGWVGSRIWDDPPAAWAGAVIGGAAGLVVGGIVGYVRSGGGNAGMPMMIRIPL